MTVSQQLRHAIKECGSTHYRIAKDVGIDTAILDRFVSGKELQTRTVDVLCEYFGLELRQVGRRTAKTSPKQSKKKPATASKQRPKKRARTGK